MNNDLIVYVTTFNRAEYLREMLNSIQTQTFSRFKVFVLDNCSTDNTREVVQDFLSDNRFEYHKNETNIGGAGNINLGFKAREGKYFCVLHDDDVCLPTLFEDEIKYLENNPKCVAVSCLADHIDETGKKIREVANVTKPYTYTGTGFFKRYIGEQKSFNFPPTMYRRDFISGNEISLHKGPGPSGDVLIFMDIEKFGGELCELNKKLYLIREYSNQDSSQHLETMLIQFIHYINNDNYYGALLSTYRNETNRYFCWYFRRLMSRVAAKRISSKQACSYLGEMRKELGTNNILYFAYKSILFFEGLFSGAAHSVYNKYILRRRSKIV